MLYFSQPNISNAKIGTIADRYGRLYENSSEVTPSAIEEHLEVYPEHLNTTVSGNTLSCNMHCNRII